MSDRAFVDTNILIYAHDSGAGRKHELARGLIEDLWQRRVGVLSTQVLQEFYVNVRRKATHPIPLGDARDLVRDYLVWEVVINDGDSLLRALEIERRYRLSFWDSLIIQAANVASVNRLYSEDLSHGQQYGALQLVNPLLS